MKKALLIGINYIGSKNELNGCINDVHKIKDLLISSYEYHETDITCLTDYTDEKPTRENIIKHFDDLVTTAQPEDILCFYYSGHGAKIKDENNDEISGFDDALYTMDKKFILDDDILNILIKLQGAHISLFFDCCHSGTICDLECNLIYKNSVFSEKRYGIWSENSKPINGNVCVYSGCLDDQYSADTQFIKNKIPENDGAFTYALLECITKQNKSITNKEFIKHIYIYLKNKHFTQIPQLSCSNSKLIDQLFFI